MKMAPFGLGYADIEFIVLRNISQSYKTGLTRRKSGPNFCAFFVENFMLNLVD
jgi:hypothetical protein